MLGPEGRVQDRACHHFPKNPQTTCEIINIDSSVPSPQVYWKEHTQVVLCKNEFRDGGEFAGCSQLYA